MSNKLLRVSKEKTEHWFTPIMRLIAKTKVHPNFLTMCSFLSGLCAVIFLKEKGLFILFGVLSITFDILDGHLARYANKVTDLGAFLDEGSDRSIELLLIIFSPVQKELIFLAICLFVIHQLLFLFFVRTKFFARTLLIVIFAVQLYSVGVLVAVTIYGLGIFWQLIQISKKCSRSKFKKHF